MQVLEAPQDCPPELGNFQRQKPFDITGETAIKEAKLTRVLELKCQRTRSREQKIQGGHEFFTAALQALLNLRTV
ncbi:hypothetical protein EYF80_016658 [Liparis tanakae]|uniref:Uncharacterized protein n=1 Tax=Liparis tanakae TaxID=230148 RepID=A0A4Z2I7B9_9TELE|nr:hypothetical protein EYF80_016658 [Liparis tanakae]